MPEDKVTEALRFAAEPLSLSEPLREDGDAELGDVVERQLKNGDIVLFNRQPTLHKASMLAKRIIVRPCKTFRFNLASTKSFNADQ
jgi:DNA-directed RNA polymerase beta' subunit